MDILNALNHESFLKRIVGNYTYLRSPSALLQNSNTVCLNMDIVESKRDLLYDKSLAIDFIVI